MLLTLQGFQRLGSFPWGICILSRLWLYCFGRLFFMPPRILFIWFSNFLSESIPETDRTHYTDLSQVTDKRYYIMLYTSPWSRFEPSTSVVIGLFHILYTDISQLNENVLNMTKMSFLFISDFLLGIRLLKMGGLFSINQFKSVIF